MIGFASAAAGQLRRGENVLPLPRAGIGNGLVGDIGQPRVGRREGQLPIGPDQLVAEVRGPRIERGPRRQVGRHAVGAHQQQRIGLAHLAGRGIGRVELAHCPQRRSQRIAGPQEADEVVGIQLDAFGLQHDGVAAALDVDRPAVRGMRSFVGHDRIGDGSRSRLAPRFVHFDPRAFDAGLDGGQAVERFPALAVIGVFEPGELLGGDLQLVELFAEAAFVVFDVAEPQPLVGQLGLGLGAGLVHLVDAPTQFIERFLAAAGGFGFGLFRGFDVSVAGEGVQQHQERPHRADEGIQEWEHLDAGAGLRSRAASSFATASPNVGGQAHRPCSLHVVDSFRRGSSRPTSWRARGARECGP